jgi:hypothetical protein
MYPAYFSAAAAVAADVAAAEEEVVVAMAVRWPIPLTMSLSHATRSSLSACLYARLACHTRTLIIWVAPLAHVPHSHLLTLINHSLMTIAA